MDEAMKMMAWIIVLAGCTLLAPAMGAQALQDPTRPPAPLMAVAKGDASAAIVAEGPRLQSILIARTQGGRHVAVIDGLTVRPGDMFKGSRVEHMTQTEVVLLKDGKKKVLKLFPAVAAGKNAQPVQR